MDITIDSLSLARGGRPVLTGVTAQVPAGSALILRGPNGSGKTSLLRVLAGLQPPLEGQVSPGPDAMAYAAHSDGLKAALTVAENLRFWARIYGTTPDAALEAFDLRALASRPAASLSAGQKRRLGLARMVLSGRPVWLFDEPTISLDQTRTAQFARMVQAHLAQGGSAILATHIDLGLDAQTLDITPFRAKPALAADAFGEGW